MSRELKFRAYCPHSKKMIPYDGMDTYYSNFQDQLYYRSLRDLFGKGTDHIWMQFTGLKDKNGKEIYEGDIIIDEAPICYGIPMEVKYISGVFGVSYPTMATDTTPLVDLIRHVKDDGGYVEVIGNIYENPELLEESNE